MGTRLQLRLFGNPEVTLGGVPVAGLLPAKAQALLYYLAVTCRPQTRSRLAGLLWGDTSDEAARANLRKVLSDLRLTLGTHLVIQRDTVAIQPDCDCWIDVAVFEAGVGAAAPVDHQRLEQAVDLYRGDFLAGFAVLHAPDFDAWMYAEQARLRELAVQALYTLAVACTEPEQLQRGIGCARRLLVLEPWREEAHCQLMQLLALAGQRSAALAQFDICRRMLAQELDVEPMSETLDLYERIRAEKIIPLRKAQPAVLARAIGRNGAGAPARQLLSSLASRWAKANLGRSRYNHS